MKAWIVCPYAVATVALVATALGVAWAQDGSAPGTDGGTDGLSAVALNDPIPGPIPADLIRVIDGDTLVVRAHIWPGQMVETAVRVSGIDTPELRGDCDMERSLAFAARDRAVALATAGPLTLGEVRHGTYAGRVVATVDTAMGSLGAVLIGEGLAAAYDGRGARPDWCAQLGRSEN